MRLAMRMRRASVGRSASTMTQGPEIEAHTYQVNEPAPSSNAPDETAPMKKGPQPMTQSVHPTCAIVPLTRWRSRTDAISASASNAPAERPPADASSSSAFASRERRARRAQEQHVQHELILDERWVGPALPDRLLPHEVGQLALEVL